MTDQQITLDVSHVIVALLALLGSLGAAKLVFRGTRETSASSILESVWTKFGALEVRVQNLEGKVNRRDYLLMLSRGHINQQDEVLRPRHEQLRVEPHPELRPFLSTGLIDSDQTGSSTTVKLEVSP